MNVEKEYCLECSKTVYPTERVAADGKIYHKFCFRCKKCNNVLKLGSYASMGGEVFCKPCFKKNFFSKGNYSDGFGKLTPQQEHDQKSGRVPEVAKSSNPSAANASAESSPTITKEVRPLPTPVVKPSTPPVQETPKVSAEPPKSESPEITKAQPIPAKVNPPRAESPKASPKENPFKSSDSGAAKTSGSKKCEVCGKSVYPMEELKADDKIFHKTCFRCKKCNGVLKLGNYASMNGEVFCKVCFKKNFFSKGNYSDGFGKLTPQQEFDQKSGKQSEPVAVGGFQGFKKVESQPPEKGKRETSTNIVASPPATKAPQLEKKAPEPEKSQNPSEEKAEDVKGGNDEDKRESEVVAVGEQ